MSGVESFPGAGIPAEHPRYLPMSTKDNCGERAPGRTPYKCTRFPGHAGDHGGHGGNMRLLARWPQEETR